MIGFELSEEQRQLQDTAKRFAENEIKPIAAEVDNIADPAQAFRRDIMQKGFELGFHSLLIPEKYGGIGGTPLDYAILLEELAVADLGMANAFHVCMSMSELISKTGTEEQCERWLVPMAEDDTGTHMVSFGCTEPSGGSEIFCPLPDPKLGTRTTARKEGDDYIINGRKVFSSNAGVAKICGTLARTDTSKPNMESCSMFLFPFETPGFSIGTIENKMGVRSSVNGEMVFEDMRLSKDHLLGEEGSGFETLNAIYDINGMGLGSQAVGVARAAYEMALDYAKERHIWGQPIGKYQAIGHMLVDMKADIEMARLMVRRVAWQATNECSEGEVPPNFAKVYPAEMARRVTVQALQIMGGAGYMKDYPMEKYVRDAMVMPIIGGANEVLKTFMSQRLLES
jgi:butyryl-CoA dehydrogenase